MTPSTEDQITRRRAAARRRYAANPEKVKAWQREYRAANAEKVNAQVRARRAADPEHARALQRTWYAANSGKINAQNRAIRDRSKDRDTQLRRAHGLRREQWTALWDAQDGRCYLCGDSLVASAKNGTPAKAVVDHNHGCCGMKRSCPACRRGLACSSCNLIIGWALDNPARLRLIAANLEVADAAALIRINSGSVQDVLPWLVAAPIAGV